MQWLPVSAVSVFWSALARLALDSPSPLSPSVPTYRQVRDFLEVIIIADSRMPFEESWRQQFLEALASVLNSIPIVVDVQTLSRDEIEALGLRLDDNVM